MIQTSSVMVALGLLGTGAVVLLYGIRLLTDAFQQAINARVQKSLHHLTRHPLLAFGLGVCVTTLLQSSNAMASLLVGLVSTEILPLTVAVVLLLGANVGSTFVVQLLAWHLTTNALLVVGLGTLVALCTRGTALRQLGQTCFASGLVLLGLDLISQGSQPLLSSPLIVLLLQTQKGAPVLLLLIGALLAVITSSSAASISLILSLAATGAIPPVAALALMFGANVGTTLTALFSALQSGTVAGRRLALIHTGTKLFGASVLLSTLSPLATQLASLWPKPETQVAMMHLLFNGTLALLFVPVAPWLARFTTWLLPEPSSTPGQHADLRLLDQQALEIPELALGQATRAVLCMAEVTETMLEQSMEVFKENKGTFQANIQRQEHQLDELNRAIKYYLTRLDGTQLSPWQANWEIMLFSLVTDLEAIGDVVTTRCMSIAKRKHRDGFLFSVEGREDLQFYHREILEAFQYVLAAMVAWDGDLANVFLINKHGRSRVKHHLRLRHMQRLRTGNALSLASSGLHLDLLDAFREILEHTTSMAYTIRDRQRMVPERGETKSFRLQSER